MTFGRAVKRPLRVISRKCSLFLNDSSFRVVVEHFPGQISTLRSCILITGTRPLPKCCVALGFGKRELAGQIVRPKPSMSMFAKRRVRFASTWSQRTASALRRYGPGAVRITISFNRTIRRLDCRIQGPRDQIWTPA